jgi:hypothetical protein
MMEEIATRESWTTHPLPEKHARLTASWTFTRKEFEQMKYGLIPTQMEDKWFIYYEDCWLHFHRSWTGYCIYQVEFNACDDFIEVLQILVSKDLEQYRESSDEYDLMLLKYMIDSFLLGKVVEFPYEEDFDSEVTSALYRHHLIGREKKPGK